MGCGGEIRRFQCFDAGADAGAGASASASANAVKGSGRGAQLSRGSPREFAGCRRCFGSTLRRAKVFVFTNLIYRVLVAFGPEVPIEEWLTD